MSTNGDHPSACLALKAAQAGLTEGLLCLRMASSAHGIGALLGKGEFLGGGAGALSGLARGSLLCSQFNIFLTGGLGGGGSGELWVDDGDTAEDDGFFYGEAAGAYHFAASGGGAGVGNKSNGSRPATKVGVPTHGLYGPHGSGTGICGGIVARGLQGQFPDCFCLKTRCGFASDSSKNYLSKLEQGAFYVKENNSHGYCKLFLSSEAAKLAPEGLLESRNNMPGWKAVICQLEDQLAVGPTTEQAAAVQAEGLLDFADRMLKTPYAATPMRPSRRRQHDLLEDGNDAKDGGGSRSTKRIC